MSDLTFDQNLRKYANLLVKVGVNITEGDLLYLRVSMTDDPNIRKLAHYTIEAAYQAGAKYVDLIWNDEEAGKLRLLHAPEDSLDYVPNWRIQEAETYAEEGVARLVFFGSNPDLFAGIDHKKVATMQRATQAATAHLVPKLIDKNVWSLAAVPVQAWADKVFPDAPEEERNYGMRFLRQPVSMKMILSRHGKPISKILCRAVNTSPTSNIQHCILQEMAQI